MKNPIKVVSLERSTDRRDIFTKNNAHLEFEFFNAVEGAAIKDDAVNYPELFGPGLQYTAGAYGCAMSHLLLWQQAIASGTTMTILEDDAVVRHDFQSQSARILEQMPAGWDIVVWGWNFDSILSLNVLPDISSAVLHFNQEQLRASIGQFQQFTDAPSVLKLDKCFGTPAYSISAGGAKKFMERCFPLTHFELFFPGLERSLPNNGIDISMNRIYSEMKSFCCLPPLAATRNEHATSLIQTVL